MNQYHTYPKAFLTFFIVLIFQSIATIAQVTNDECTTAEPIMEVASFCSLDGAFSNENSTSSPLTGSSDFSANGKDVWFSFTAIASDLSIAVNGRGDGGTLRDPQIQLLATKDCEEFFILAEATESTADVTELSIGGLIPGATYFFRVQGQNGQEGTFQLCIYNFFPPQAPGSDIEDAATLCDKSSFTLQLQGGAGADANEADGTCLDTDGVIGDLFGLSTEQNATWFTWIAANDGPLSFTITPIDPDDDFDFVVYELPNGLNNGNGKIVLRCMAAGCKGPTGLSEESQDLQEDEGCEEEDNKDNFVKAIQLQEGKAYGVLINNWVESSSESISGFHMEFGGTGEFQGPEANIGPSKDGVPFKETKICLGEEVSFTGEESTFVGGNITDYQWIFGEGAVPETATGVNPGEVRYTEPGVKTVVLTITTSLGCEVTEVRESIIIVDTCCLAVTLEADINPLKLGESTTLTTTATDAIGMVTYQWSPIDILSCTDCSSPTATPMETTTVSVTITDEAGCEAIDTISLEVEIEIKEITVPNAFTPDFDGTNDRFTILGGGPNDRIVSLQIFSRWGELVYEGKNLSLGDSNAGWDGNYKGERQQPDIYIYQAVVLTEGEERAFTGDIMLIR